MCTLVQRYLNLRSKRLEDVLCAHMTCYYDPKLSHIFQYTSRLCFSMMSCVRLVSEIAPF